MHVRKSGFYSSFSDSFIQRMQVQTTNPPPIPPSALHLFTCALLDTGFQASSLASEGVDEVAGAQQRSAAALVPEEGGLEEAELPAKGLLWRQHEWESAQVLQAVVVEEEEGKCSGVQVMLGW